MYDVKNQISVLCDNLEGWNGEGSGVVFKREGTFAYLMLIHVKKFEESHHSIVLIL